MLVILASFVFATCADRLENTYLPPNSAQTAAGNGNILAAPINKARPAAPSQGAPSQPHAGPASPQVNILRFENENNGDGSYNYGFETDNHIQQQESGHLKAGADGESVEAQGSYTFTAPDGQTFTIQYVADENGFQPQGAHLPTAPPVPEEILKALEKNAADEAAGIVDDGQYRPDASEGKYSGNGQGQTGNGGYKY
ncbi:endocuticle structural glycoprotein SgAbd-2 isoform X2 [Aethina tumida]|uniref:endocuticle structural glycoprotein SgAbd-2 isoform X2 n=1 Tax=Aethina tumida TaxID=116153 RepID=UPI002148E9BD|nr:endocuticle structural glycoprotein SgAbd-2 isoform X2 [Aethina tumida]